MSFVWCCVLLLWMYSFLGGKREAPSTVKAKNIRETEKLRKFQDSGSLSLKLHKLKIASSVWDPWMRFPWVIFHDSVGPSEMQLLLNHFRSWEWLLTGLVVHHTQVPVELFPCPVVRISIFARKSHVTDAERILHSCDILFYFQIIYLILFPLLCLMLKIYITWMSNKSKIGIKISL